MTTRHARLHRAVERRRAVAEPTAIAGPTGAAEPTGAARLRELHARGVLAEEYGQVAGVLRGLDGRELARAGALLARLDPAAVRARHPDLPVVRVTLSAGRMVTAPLVPPLTAELARHGLLLDARLGEFGGWVGELADPQGPLSAHRPDLALLLLDPFSVLDGLPPVWDAADAAKVLAERLDTCAALAAGHRRGGRVGVLVLNTVPLLRRHTHQLLDLGQRAAFGAAWREFNAGLLRLSAPGEGVVVLDLDPVASAGARADDPRLGVYAGAPLSADLLAGYAREVAHLARALRGRAKKCLVLDLDGTLWDGVLDADGPDGVMAADSLRGRAFHALQTVLRQLSAQGVLLAVASKNDEETVRAVLRDHPGLQLREPDFAAIRSGWGPKPEALLDLADALGLGADALVFADDSPVEQGLVAAVLPEVTVLPLDAEPALHLERLLADGWFDALRLTDDDRARPARYQGRLRRARAGVQALDHGAYLRSLQVVVSLAPVRPDDLARTSQLTLRTNRLNATGSRRQPSEVRAALAHGPVLAVRVQDRFGDEGLVGALFVTAADDAWTLDDLVLSCRALGRGVEDACVAAFVAAARRAGARRISARLRPNRSNSAVLDLYRRHGFVAGEGELLRLSDGGSSRVPEHIRMEAAP
ncbi:HAD-IIIC family phosphatase [Streptacidiphilus sp. PB12-B1b]|uniref:HAD-IIIC family phosphatase n=1 Tax=Streptacidiphilus sp. PB12-B1b TaxID=2705012 RepID=UPI0015FC5DB8|nr:HAD-IIIC family phosphatase [Streptacidiphilus sp. PB12-B1b]QMU78139.1 HAD-IIIC family phosphatase [Streptacidiphilus sp. PB12-B1b]